MRCAVCEMWCVQIRVAMQKCRVVGDVVKVRYSRQSLACGKQGTRRVLLYCTVLCTYSTAGTCEGQVLRSRFSHTAFTAIWASVLDCYVVSLSILST